MSSVQSVVRAMALLEAVADEPAGLSTLARRVDLPVSTASRLLTTLEGVGAVERVDEVGSFRIGPRIVNMSRSVSTGPTLVALTDEALVSLSAAFNEAAGLSVASGYTVHYLSQIEVTRSVRVEDWVGHIVPMHLVSSGYALLAYWGDDAIETFLEHQLVATTSASVTDPAVIRKRLDQVRADGYIWTMEEFVEGLSSIAAPLFNSTGEVVAAVHIHGPSYRFPADRNAVERELLATTASLSSLL